MKHIQNLVVDPQFDINPGGYVKSRTLTCIAALVPAKKVNQRGCDTEIEHVISWR